MSKGLHCALLAALATAPAAVAVADVRVPYEFVNERIVVGLDMPRAFAFLPDGRALVIEQRTAKVRLIIDHRLGLVDPLFVVPDVQSEQYEQGMQGIAVDPRWPERPYVYFYYTARGYHGRLVRYTVTGDVVLFDGEILQFEDPLLLIDDIPDQHWWHNAGALHFGPDSCLYLSLGDDGFPCAAQDSCSLHGCILRLDTNRLPDGPGGPMSRAILTPEGNPFPTADSVAAMVYAYGFRNPWCFSIDPVDSSLYVADVGEVRQEELDHVTAGGNYGWPFREGKFLHDDMPCEEPGGRGSSLFRDPFFTVERTTGLATIFTTGRYRSKPGASGNWPAEYEGDLFWGDYFGGSLCRMRRKQDGGWVPVPPVPGQPDSIAWGTGFETAVDFAIAPDGSLWWLRQNNASYDELSGEIQRIRYDETAVLSAERPPADAGLALAISPNPSRGAAEFAFGVAEPGRVRLSIYDLSGRRVRSLFDGPGPAGAARVRWDGGDEGGRRVAPGVYLARIEQGGVATTRRIVRLD